MFAFTAFLGISTQYGDTTKIWVKGAQDIRFGIDIRGGVDVTFMPADGVEATDDQMTAAKTVIEDRLVGLGITDYEDYVDYNKDRIIVRFRYFVSFILIASDNESIDHRVAGCFIIGKCHGCCLVCLSAEGR